MVSHTINSEFMSIYLFTVADTFTIRNRGIVLAPGFLPAAHEMSFHIRIGDPIELHRPDGSQLEACIRGIEMINAPIDVILDRQRRCPILLPANLTKADIPAGTEVWLKK
jgi:hypothetical protein